MLFNVNYNTVLLFILTLILECNCQLLMNQNKLMSIDSLTISETDRNYTEVIVKNGMCDVAQCYFNGYVLSRDKLLAVVYDEKNSNCSIIFATSIFVNNKAEGSYSGGEIFISVDFDKIMEAVKTKVWKVIQRNINPNGTSFDQDWSTYKAGFGSSDNVTDNFWIGLKAMNILTRDSPRKLRIEMTRYSQSTVYVAQYDQFQVGPESSNFTLSISGFNSSVSTAGDSMTNAGYGANDRVNGMMFSTKDMDNDQRSGSCSAERFNIGWWFNDCGLALPNGKLKEFEATDYLHAYWNSLTGGPTTLQSIKMSALVPVN